MNEIDTIIDALDVPGWTKLAACRNSSPDLFFPEQGDSNCVARARAVCFVCPVRTPCLEYALENRERHGVWGGASERERRAMLRRRREAA